MAEIKAPKRPGRVTIRDVASDAGVSVAAVSKVLRDAYGVSDSLREKVRVSMDKLSYRPLASARGLRGRTYTLGILFPDMRNPFFADIFDGVTSALARTQYQAMQGVSVHANELVDAMIDRQMDGFILIGPNEESLRLVALAKRVPLVLVGHYEPGAGLLDTVNNDDQLGAKLVVRHLATNGYRRIAMVSLNQEPSTIIRQRELGYRIEMMEQGLGTAIQITRSSQTLRDVQSAIRKILESPDRPDALFCWTDLIAIEAISVATDMGLSIPGDIAIVGYDNTMYCDFAQNRLTSVDQSGELLGLQAARLLIERIEGRTEAEHFVVTPRIVARASSRRS
ncbi:LacI family DNA-binding transcriptional regulator [Devosia rhizoryzae]|uniref:LacI family DNA-binding transcriptional regulator n=1 Tax=Devosia rhizoryzae TaxID=2774137 RepID=A0ABX7CA53_9HYPH|nr:LacI family DNA-binding transcriptional regulator [Devosia rhizoryzae]QQR39475.1 LacI family DNA-binding transcriptional regulator [Devosia rhizoryzae]